MGSQGAAAVDDVGSLKPGMPLPPLRSQMGLVGASSASTHYGAGGSNPNASGGLKHVPKPSPAVAAPVAVAAPKPRPAGGGGQMIEVVCNDRLGKKVRVKIKYVCTHDRSSPSLDFNIVWIVILQQYRHGRGLEEDSGRADGHATGEDQNPEVVQHLQGPHQPPRLRNPRRHGPRALLQLRQRRLGFILKKNKSLINK
ncbi:hypothetical protein HMI54_013999 [Coelomomyces lativittatus]|nr:hypothetical protein HMI54_013999 [Coelomomyces lativittatus]